MPDQHLNPKPIINRGNIIDAFYSNLQNAKENK